MSSIYVNAELVEQMKNVISKKADFWKKYIPHANFDEYGRMVIGSVPAVDERDIKVEILGNADDLTLELFNEYLIENNYRIRTSDNCYEYSLEKWYYLDPCDFLNNRFRFKTVRNTYVEVKISKIFNKLQDKWLKLNPLYTVICDEIKKLRKAGESYDTCEELRSLSRDKERFEMGNIYFLYQKFQNATAGSNDLILSINPLDKLSSSGNCGDNPTTFSSCWSTYMVKLDNFIKVERDGCYSNPEAQIAIGSILNCGMIFVKNGRELEIKDTGWKLYGYKERSHIWLDTDGLWIEKMYPTKSKSRKKYITDIVNNFYKVKTFDERDKYQYPEFNIQDIEGIENYLKATNNDDDDALFLDRVAITFNKKLVYLMADRMSFSYRNADRIPEETDVIECSCCGESFYEADMACIGGEWYCSSCTHENFIVCDSCDEYCHVDDIIQADGYNYCPYCADFNTFLCDDCGEYHRNTYSHRTYAYDIDGNRIEICDSCLENNYILCDACEEYHHIANITQIDGDNYCEYCRDSRFTECLECGNYEHNEVMLSDGLCRHCHAEHETNEVYETADAV